MLDQHVRSSTGRQSCYFKLLHKPPRPGRLLNLILFVLPALSRMTLRAVVGLCILQQSGRERKVEAVEKGGVKELYV